MGWVGSGGGYSGHPEIGPTIGPTTLDCDVLLLPDTDQRMVVYSAARDSQGGEALDLLRVVGLQELSR